MLSTGKVKVFGVKLLVTNLSLPLDSACFFNMRDFYFSVMQMSKSVICNTWNNKINVLAILQLELFVLY